MQLGSVLHIKWIWHECEDRIGSAEFCQPALFLTVAGIYRAPPIPNDPAIDRLAVAGDPVARATVDCDRLFPEGDQALIMLEGTDPLSPAALRATDQLERQLAKIVGVKAHSL